VDLSKITWVLSGDEHVAEYRPPANVVPIEPGRKMADLLVGGELAAAIGVDVDAPHIAPLIPDAAEAGYAALQATGHYPINHLVVVKDELLARHPGLARAVFDAFAQSKRLYVERLRAGTLDKPTAVDEMHRRVMAITGADPLPYGIEPNRGALAQALAAMRDQGIVDRPGSLEELFHPETHGLVA
jgi:4,5-dihydroxyphthalate decarboxylase